MPEMRPEDGKNRKYEWPAFEEVPALRRQSGSDVLRARDSIQRLRLVRNRLRRGKGQAGDRAKRKRRENPKSRRSQRRIPLRRDRIPKNPVPRIQQKIPGAKKRNPTNQTNRSDPERRNNLD